MNCPTCGLLNLPAAEFCIHCKSPIDIISRPSPASSTGAHVVDLSRVKTLIPSSGAAQPQRATQSDWREQLSLKLERLKEKSSDSAVSRPGLFDEDFRLREFVRPASPGDGEPDAVRRAYHPLAEKALEKIDRAKTSSAENVQGSPPQLEAAVLARPEIDLPNSSRRSARRSEKPERIEIDLGQASLPFDTTEMSVSVSREDQVRQGLVAAALAPRIKAGLIDTLFVFGSFLIFLLIVFFVPEFALFSKSCLLGMGFVLLLIFLSYAGTFTILGARTLGMDHELLEVVTYQGTPISSGEACLRSFGYLVSLGCFGLGFLWALFDPERLTWHDKISRTLVVQKGANRGALSKIG